LSEPRAAAAPDGTIDLDEVRLIRRAKNGDVQAFEGLYRRYSRRVFGLCLRMTADKSVAEDLTQETFVRVWERLDRFEGGARFAPWILKVTANVVLSHGRTRRRKFDKEQQAEWLDDVPSATPAAPPGAGVDLERAIGLLPNGARTVFVLHDVEGLRHREISELLGVAEGTTKAQLHRARRMLREALA
jgi:RNA polymerase sigma-70 factor (ECF subfamily)